jgi:hypothetical protein
MYPGLLLNWCLSADIFAHRRSPSQLPWLHLLFIQGRAHFVPPAGSHSFNTIPPRTNPIPWSASGVAVTYNLESDGRIDDSSVLVWFE